VNVPPDDRLHVKSEAGLLAHAETPGELFVADHTDVAARACNVQELFAFTVSVGPVVAPYPVV
jgi:hypothetical protein